MIIYKITNKINKKLYVGLTTIELSERFKIHTGKNSQCTALKEAIKYFGVENFTIEEIEKCSSLEELKMREEFWIKELSTLAPDGYNLTTGGECPRHSEITKQKMSATRKGKHPHWATKASNSKESRDKVADKLCDKERSQECKDKIKATLIAQRGKKIVDQNGVVYNTVVEAAKTLGLSRGNIQMQLRGLRKRVGEYNFRFV